MEHESLLTDETEKVDYLYLHGESTATKLELQESCTNSTLGHRQLLAKVSSGEKLETYGSIRGAALSLMAV